MPHGGIVDLISIRIVRRDKGIRVILEFADSANRRHSVEYLPRQFVQAMERLASGDSRIREQGLRLLGMLPQEDRGKRTYLLPLSSTTTANLGDLRSGAGFDLLRMLDSRVPFSSVLKQNLRRQTEAELRNPFRH